MALGSHRLQWATANQPSSSFRQLGNPPGEMEMGAKLCNQMPRSSALSKSYLTSAQLL